MDKLSRWTMILVMVGTAGDVNGDGYADIVVTAPYFDNPDTDEGAVFVWHGSASGLGDPGAPANADWQVYGDQAAARLGGYDLDGTNTAGDANGDGLDDVIVGTPTDDNPGPADSGRAYVYHGSAACRVRLNDDPTDYYTVPAAVNASTNPSDVVKVAGTCRGA